MARIDAGATAVIPKAENHKVDTSRKAVAPETIGKPAEPLPVNRPSLDIGPLSIPKSVALTGGIVGGAAALGAVGARLLGKSPLLGAGIGLAAGLAGSVLSGCTASSYDTDRRYRYMPVEYYRNWHWHNQSQTWHWHGPIGGVYDTWRDHPPYYYHDHYWNDVYRYAPRYSDYDYDWYNRTYRDWDWDYHYTPSTPSHGGSGWPGGSYPNDDYYPGSGGTGSSGGSGWPGGSSSDNDYYPGDSGGSDYPGDNGGWPGGDSGSSGSSGGSSGDGGSGWPGSDGGSSGGSGSGSNDDDDSGGWW